MELLVPFVALFPVLLLLAGWGVYVKARKRIEEEENNK